MCIGKLRGKKGKYKCTMNYLSYRSSRLTMVTPFVFSNTIVPVHGVSSSSSSPVHLAILSSCHLALFLTTGDLYDLLSFYTNDRWVLYHQNVRHILWVASVQSRQMSILIWSWYLLLLNYVSCQMLCGYFDIRLVVFIKIIWSQYSPH